MGDDMADQVTREIFLCPVGAVNAATKKTLRGHGILVVESAEPERCSFLRATEVLTSNDLLWAALASMQGQPGDYDSHFEKVRSRFAVRVFSLIEAAHQKAHPKPSQEAP